MMTLKPICTHLRYHIQLCVKCIRNSAIYQSSEDAPLVTTRATSRRVFACTAPESTLEEKVNAGIKNARKIIL